MGYVVTERPFSYSSFPGRFATPLFGAAGAVMVGLAGLWAIGGSRFAPVSLMIGGCITLVVVGRWLTRHGVLVVPLLRAQGINLEAVKPGEIPRVWLCAHLDSKSQAVPTLARSAGVVLELFGIMMATVLAIVEATSAIGVAEFYWAFAGIVTLVGAVPVGLSMVGTRSPGALDNASGVVAVIAAARHLRGETGVGVLITDAEELGLAGARAWSRGQPIAAVLNVDGVDDHGDLTIMRSGPLSARMLRALSSDGSGPVPHIGPHFPGVLTEAMAFADAGLDAVSVSRGSMKSFLRVHSPKDDLRHLQGDGIAPVAELLAHAARRLFDQDRPT